MIRIVILAAALLAALVPFVPLLVIAAAVTFAVYVAARTVRRAKTRCEDQPVALFALVPFRAPPALV